MYEETSPSRIRNEFVWHTGNLNYFVSGCVKMLLAGGLRPIEQCQDFDKVYRMLATCSI